MISQISHFAFFVGFFLSNKKIIMRIIYAIIIGGLVCMETGCKDTKDEKGVGGGGGSAAGGGMGNLSPDVGKSRVEKIAEAKAAMDDAKMRLDNNEENLVRANDDLKSKRNALIDRIVVPDVIPNLETAASYSYFIYREIDRRLGPSTIQRYRDNLVALRRDGTFTNLSASQTRAIDRCVGALTAEFEQANELASQQTSLVNAIEANRGSLSPAIVEAAGTLRREPQDRVDVRVNLLEAIESSSPSPPACIQTEAAAFRAGAERLALAQGNTDTARAAMLSSLWILADTLREAIHLYNQTTSAPNGTDTRLENERKILIQVVEENHARVAAAASKEWNEYKAAKSLVENSQPAKVQADYEAKKAQYDRLVATAPSATRTT
jgi:hypothetical protein